MCVSHPRAPLRARGARQSPLLAQNGTAKGHRPVLPHAGRAPSIDDAMWGVHVYKRGGAGCTRRCRAWRSLFARAAQNLHHCASPGRLVRRGSAARDRHSPGVHLSGMPAPDIRSSICTSCAQRRRRNLYRAYTDLRTAHYSRSMPPYAALSVQAHTTGCLRLRHASICSMEDCRLCWTRQCKLCGAAAAAARRCRANTGGLRVGSRRIGHMWR